MRKFWTDIAVFAVALAAMAVLLLALSACASMPPAPPEPIIITRDVPTIVQVKCHDRRAPVPDYPDTDERLAMIEEGNIFGLAQAYRAGRTLRIDRERQNEAQISACVGD